MVERYQMQSALAHLHLAARAEADSGMADVCLREIPFRGQINLRGDGGDPAFLEATKATSGLDLPRAANRFTQTGERLALWLGPGEWLIVLDGDYESQAADALREALAEMFCAVTETGHAHATIELSGPRARDVLMKGCGLDLHPRGFGPGQCGQTLLTRTDMILLQRDETPRYEIIVRRSFAHYAWSWLEDAALEFGVAVR